MITSVAPPTTAAVDTLYTYTLTGTGTPSPTLSASGLPADVLKLPSRGYLRKGYYADLVVFDPKTFRDTATYDKPHQYASGVRYLFVNGVLTINEGKYTEALAGKTLRRGEK